MKDYYYVDIVSFGKTFTYKIKNNATGNFEIISKPASDLNCEIPYESNTYLYLHKRVKGTKQTHVIDCRQGFCEKKNITDYETSTVKKIFSTMITLHENGHKKPWAVTSIETFIKNTYPIYFKK
jgi:hypothetical protein